MHILLKLLPSDRKLFFLLIIVSIGAFFRLYSISWGSPYFFHPDERNIASSISQIRYPHQMNPHFFAYGTLPIYSIYFTGVVSNMIQSSMLGEELNPYEVRFENAIIVGRAFSFFLSLLLLYLLFALAKDVAGKKAAYISVALASLSVGFIQYAHFATFEMWLSFFTLLLCYTSIRYFKAKNLFLLLSMGGIMGILIAIKVSSLTLLPIPLFALFATHYKTFITPWKHAILFEKSLLKIMLFLAITITTVYLSAPYFWIDAKAFFNSMDYESSVALGTLPVFYTQEFRNSVPIIFQLQKIYPFILNPLLFIFLPIVLFVSTKLVIRKKSIPLLIISLFLAVAFFSQAFLYVKWVRYYIPTLPFIYILSGVSLSFLASRGSKIYKRVAHAIVLLLIITSFIYAFSYFKVVLFGKDTRVAAAEWAVEHISTSSPILSEVFDLGITPFNPHYSNITLFDFYDLDNNPVKISELNNLIESSEYIILPSQRILNTRISNPSQFPISARFYQRLEREEFEKIYSTPCDIFCKILYLNDPTFSFEQTANVFDRPTVTIYKNEQAKTD